MNSILWKQTVIDFLVSYRTSFFHTSWNILSHELEMCIFHTYELFSGSYGAWSNTLRDLPCPLAPWAQMSREPVQCALTAVNQVHFPGVLSSTQKHSEHVEVFQSTLENCWQSLWSFHLALNSFVLYIALNSCWVSLEELYFTLTFLSR